MASYEGYIPPVPPGSEDPAPQPTPPPTPQADVYDFEAERAARIASEGSPKPKEPFGLRLVTLPKAHAIPPRQWLYGTRLIRGFVTLLVAPGGTGKSSLMLGMCMALATNRPLLGEHIFEQCNVALLNLEDPQDEIDRRMAAIAMRYDISDRDIAGRFFVSPPEVTINIAAAGSDGFSVVHPDVEDIIKQVKDAKIGVLAVDPFAESHTLEENSNPQMIQAAAAWRRVARECNCAVLLAHHVRKGPVDNIEAARGAKALTDSARVGLLLSTMTEEDAEALGVSSDNRLRYVRMDDAKANMAPRASRASWFHLDNIALNNGTPMYPNGDQVVVIEAWEPPSAWDGISIPEANDVLDRIAAGPGNGSLYTDSRRHPATRWAGNILTEDNGRTPDQAATIINAWVRNGVLVRVLYADGEQRKERTGLRVIDAKRPGTTL